MYVHCADCGVEGAVEDGAGREREHHQEQGERHSKSGGYLAGWLRGCFALQTASHAAEVAQLVREVATLQKHNLELQQEKEKLDRAKVCVCVCVCVRV